MVVKIKITVNAKIWRGNGTLQTIMHFWQEFKLYILIFLMKLNMQFQSSIYPREMLTYVHKKTSIIIFLLTFLILIKHWKKLKSLRTKGWGGVQNKGKIISKTNNNMCNFQWYYLEDKKPKNTHATWFCLYGRWTKAIHVDIWDRDCYVLVVKENLTGRRSKETGLGDRNGNTLHGAFSVALL